MIKYLLQNAKNNKYMCKLTDSFCVEIGPYTFPHCEYLDATRFTSFNEVNKFKKFYETLKGNTFNIITIEES